MIASYSDYEKDAIADMLAKGSRCGNHDSQNLGESSWGIREVTWGVESWVTGLSQEVQIALLTQAFASWAKVCNLTFRRVDVNKANIVIGTGRGSRSNFDGPNGTLAWAYLPSGRGFTGRLQMRFDLDETWIDNPRLRGILFLNVATHEIGHTLGLSHITKSAQLMNAYYSPPIFEPQQWDIADVVSLYGPAVATPTTPTTPTNPNVPVSAVKAVKVQLADGRVFGASGGTVLAELPANGMVGQEWSW